MSLPQVASREEWPVARKALLAKEKQLTTQRDALNAERRRLRWSRSTRTTSSMVPRAGRTASAHSLWTHQSGVNDPRVDERGDALGLAGRYRRAHALTSGGQPRTDPLAARSARRRSAYVSGSSSSCVATRNRSKIGMRLRRV